MNPPDAPPAPSPSDFVRFHRHVLENPALLDGLRDIVRPERFKIAVVELGGAHGFTFTADEVAAALDTTRQSWLERRLG